LPKRAAACLILLGLLGMLTCSVLHTKEELGRGFKIGPLNIEKREEIDFGDETCRFVSTVDAYHRDLHRLRRHIATQKGVPLSELTDATYPSQGQYRHRFSSTGHLLVSDLPGVPHPIPLLLRMGEKHWEDLLAKQSRTLGEAVREYTRRYGRRPPKGFDVWWEFAMENQLVLPDEYDRINLDLAPFFALPKAEMKRRMQMVEDMKETFTLAVRDGKVVVQIKDSGGLKWGGTRPRANDAAM
jgi:hypothetical protein